jgi:large subunit ribosomal protein L18
MKEKKEKLERRHKKIRARVIGTSERPRFQVFRSLNHIYAQIIDDEAGKTILSESDCKETDKKKKKIEKAFEVGERIAKKAAEKKIKKVVFDRKGYLYHGRVKAVAEGARKGGMQF